jgi:hypothetical protein
MVQVLNLNRAVLPSPALAAVVPSTRDEGWLHVEAERRP